MSRNGERPVQYKGFHSNDVVRIKAYVSTHHAAIINTRLIKTRLDRLSQLLEEKDPFFMAIMPYAPHVENQRDPPTPQARHAHMFQDVKTPRFANWNPADEIQKQKGVYLKNLKPMNSEAEASADRLYRGRLRSIQGVDEIIEDVLDKLQKAGKLEETYGQYTSPCFSDGIDLTLHSHLYHRQRVPYWGSSPTRRQSFAVHTRYQLTPRSQGTRIAQGYHLKGRQRSPGLCSDVPRYHGST